MKKLPVMKKVGTFDPRNLVLCLVELETPPNIAEQTALNQGMQDFCAQEFKGFTQPIFLEFSGTTIRFRQTSMTQTPPTMGQFDKLLKMLGFSKKSPQGSAAAMTASKHTTVAMANA